MQKKEYDAVVIGGGFYGCMVALFLKESYNRILLVEKESDLLTRASYVNQARVHNGYHYPRNFLTALRSFVNFPRFTLDFQKCVENSFEKVYAIASNNSKVSASQFYKFCRSIGAPIKIAPSKTKSIFNENLIEEVFLVQEFAFNAAKLRSILKEKLEKANVEVAYQVEVQKIAKVSTDNLTICFKNSGTVNTTRAFNCTYSQINSLLCSSNLPLLPLKHEITEMALIKVPEELEHLGITIMDGPFFSTMPFPDKKLHTLSHVRYTPHQSWSDLPNYQDSHEFLKKQSPLESHYLYMIKDAQRYVPMLKEAHYVESIYEVKTVLVENETDDGRPILFRNDYGIKNLYVIMGGKIDNIYDILDALKTMRKEING